MSWVVSNLEKFFPWCQPWWCLGLTSSLDISNISHEAYHFCCSKFRFYLFCLLWHHLLLISFAGKLWKVQTDWTFLSVAVTKLLINVFLHNHCFYAYPEMLHHSNMTHSCLIETCLNKEIKIYLKKYFLSISFSLL